jgi:hypothetical protein
VQPIVGREYVAGVDIVLSARVVDQSPPDSVHVLVRPAVGGFYRSHPMRPSGSYVYSASIPGAGWREGPHDFVITVFHGNVRTTYPDGVPEQPWDWNYTGRTSWKFHVTSPRTPIVLFDPASDASRLHFTRIGDAGRRGLFRLALSGETGRPVFHLALPVDSSGWSPPDYTASLVINDRVQVRGATVAEADAVHLRVRGLGPRQTLHLTLMEDDGTSWTAPVQLDSAWRDVRLPLSGFTAARGVLLPQGFPGQWSYWVGPAHGRAGNGDRIRLDRVERIQFSLRPERGETVPADRYGMEVESVTIRFGNREE